MNVVLFHPVPLPPRDYGGIERVVLWLAKGLRDLGHRVWIAASPRSQLPEGISLIEMRSEESTVSHLLRQLPNGVDVLHFHTPPSMADWDGLPCPALMTLHGNGKSGERFHRNTLFLSSDHALRHGGMHFVHNGVDPAEYAWDATRKSEHYLFLSKTSWKVKNLRGAMDLCRRARVPLQIAGGKRPLHLRLASALTPGFRWEGPVNGVKKAELLTRARGLVFPVIWPEPFGLVVVEALMSGTPVLASRMGSLPELIDPSVGVMPESQQEWLEQLRRPAGAWDPEVCRRYAMERFGHLRMAADYVARYQQVIAGERIQNTEPVATGWRAS